MLLVLTNSDDATADYLCGILRDASIAFDRLDTDKLDGLSVSYSCPGEPTLHLRTGSFPASSVTNVWYRRPEPLMTMDCKDPGETTFVRGEWSAAIDSYFAHIPSSRWMNHPASNASASHKPEQLTTASRLGLRVPDTLLTQDPAEAKRFYQAHRAQIVVKPVYHGYIERDAALDSQIYTNLVESDDFSAVVSCPTYLQEYINKDTDVRITAIDANLHAVRLSAAESDGRQRCDVRRNNMDDVEYSAMSIPEPIAQQLRNLISHYQLRFAAIDMCIDDHGSWYFLEVNPNGQWAWLDIVGGQSICSSFVSSFK